MDLQTVIQTRRSVREFAKRPIPEAVLTRILEAARIAPSACNFQPWRFVVVQDPAMKTTLVPLCKNQASVGAAATVIVCCGKRYANDYCWMGENLFLVDVAIAIDHMQLVAREEGVGSCWIGAFENEPIKKLLRIPADNDVVMLLVLGYPASDAAFHTNTERLTMAQIAFTEKFGQPRKS